MPLIERDYRLKEYSLIEKQGCPRCGGPWKIMKDISDENGKGYLLKCFGTCGHEYAMNVNSGLVRDNTVVFPQCQKSET